MLNEGLSCTADGLEALTAPRNSPTTVPAYDAAMTRGVSKPATSNSNALADEDRHILFQALEVQRRLLPFALALFAVGLPIFIWAASYARNAGWLAACFVIFVIAWGAFYAASLWLRKSGGTDLAVRARVHILCGLLWAAAVLQISIFAHGAGPMREVLLLMAAAAAATCLFFSAPYLPALLIITPVAAAGPLLTLAVRSESRFNAIVALAGLALAMTFSLILNIALRRQFTLAAERESLIQARDASLLHAERLAKSKSDIVATLSHEIRNGLTGVTHVLAASVGHGGRAAPSREQLGAALAATNDLVTVLNATLDSETAEAGRLPLDMHPFDPVSLISDLVLLNRPHAATKGVEMSLHVDPILERRLTGAAMGDVSRVRQVLANLIGNAVKYTVRGRIEVRAEPADAGHVLISVADTGPGLSSEELETAFEPFARIERTGAGVPGAGLGLSLSRHLATMMGGTIEATSALNVGSCFTFTLPWDETVTVEPLVTEEAGFLSRSRPSGRAMRVLIAEDDALNAAMLRAILEQLGHQVVHAQNGRRAVELAGVCDFDLMMIDGRMPQMDGPAATLAIRALPGQAGLAPIIAVIGGDAEDARECLDAGADAILRKPVSVGAVARAVADAAAGAAREETAQRRAAPAA